MGGNRDPGKAPQQLITDILSFDINVDAADDDRDEEETPEINEPEWTPELLDDSEE